MPQLTAYGSVRARVQHWGLPEQAREALLTAMRQMGIDKDAKPSLLFYTRTQERIRTFEINFSVTKFLAVVAGVGNSLLHAHQIESGNLSFLNIIFAASAATLQPSFQFMSYCFHTLRHVECLKSQAYTSMQECLAIPKPSSTGKRVG